MFRCLFIPAVLSAAVASGLEVRPLSTVCRPVTGEARTWDTRYFRIHSEVEVSPPDLARLAAVADATARAVEKHPIPWFDPPRGARARLEIRSDSASYELAGATPGTAGMYLRDRRAVVLDAGHLFPAADDRDRLRPLPDEEILIHEVVHLCMHGSQGHLPQWFAEGLCEYFAAAHRGAGVFRFDDMDRGIRDHLRRRFGPDSESIPALPLTSIIGLDSREWLDFMLELPADERYRGYVSSLLLAHYHLHATARRQEIAQAFKQRPPTLPPGFAGLAKSASTIEDQLTKYWTGKGVKIRFTR